MIKKILTFAFGVLFSTVVLAEFQGQLTLGYVTTPPNDPLVGPADDERTVPVSGSIQYTFDGGVTCTISVTSATRIVIGPCDFGPFGNGGGNVTFNGFRFTQAAADPDITGVTPTGPVTSVDSNADSIAVNLINQNLNAATVTLDVNFAAPQSIPVLTPVGFGLFGLLMAGVSYWARRRR